MQGSIASILPSHEVREDARPFLHGNFPGLFGKNPRNEHQFALTEVFILSILKTSDRSDICDESMVGMVLTEGEKHSSRGRALILQAALQLFSERGYDGTSIDDIRQAAGFKSKASLYTHFKSKEEIASALLQDILEEENRVLMEAYAAAEAEPLSQLFAMGRAYIEWVLNNPEKYAFCFLRAQTEALIQGKPASSIGGERPPSSELLLLDLIHDLRREYPVRQIADAALLGMMMSVSSRVLLDQTAFGPISKEGKMQQIMEVAMSMLFTEPVSLPG
jgi:AcrR family transcriptional regulator